MTKVRRQPVAAVGQQPPRGHERRRLAARRDDQHLLPRLRAPEDGWLENETPCRSAVERTMYEPSAGSKKRELGPHARQLRGGRDELRELVEGERRLAEERVGLARSAAAGAGRGRRARGRGGVAAAGDGARGSPARRRSAAPASDRRRQPPAASSAATKQRGPARTQRRTPDTLSTPLACRSPMRSATPSRYACQSVERLLARLDHDAAPPRCPSGACAEHHGPRVLAVAALDLRRARCVSSIASGGQP